MGKTQVENVDLEKWKAAALALEGTPSRPRTPLHVLLGEAVDVARFFERYWPAQVRDGVVVQAGLETAAGDGGLHAGMGEEILELQSAMQAAQTNYLLRVEAAGASRMQRAHFILREIIATLGYVFEAERLHDDDARLARFKEQHGRVRSEDAVAAALDDYAGLANVYRTQINGRGGFDTALIDEAHEVAQALRERSADQLISLNREAQSALDLRNRLGDLLQQRISAVRAAARFVFRHDPETIRKVTSRYHRQRRMASRRKLSTQPLIPPRDIHDGTDTDH